MVTLEELVPQDHLLRLINRHIQFDFIRERTSHLYCADNGRPALDPDTLFKMLFIGYLFGIRSEQQLEREVQVNVAYHWFLGLRLIDKIPHASHAIAELTPAVHRVGYFYKREYVYDSQRDRYVCQNGEFLAYRTTNRRC